MGFRRAAAARARAARGQNESLLRFDVELRFRRAAGSGLRIDGLSRGSYLYRKAPSTVLFGRDSARDDAPHSSRSAGATCGGTYRRPPSAGRDRSPPVASVRKRPPAAADRGAAQSTFVADDLGRLGRGLSTRASRALRRAASCAEAVPVRDYRGPRSPVWRSRSHASSAIGVGLQPELSRSARRSVDRSAVPQPIATGQTSSANGACSGNCLSGARRRRRCGRARARAQIARPARTSGVAADAPQRPPSRALRSRSCATWSIATAAVAGIRWTALAERAPRRRFALASAAPAHRVIVARRLRAAARGARHARRCPFVGLSLQARGDYAAAVRGRREPTARRQSTSGCLHPA
jgi:hypothetical protein